MKGCDIEVLLLFDILILSQCSGEEERAQGWRVLFILLVVACIVGLAMIVVSSS